MNKIPILKDYMSNDTSDKINGVTTFVSTLIYYGIKSQKIPSDALKIYYLRNFTNAIDNSFKIFPEDDDNDEKYRILMEVFAGRKISEDIKSLYDCHKNNDKDNGDKAMSKINIKELYQMGEELIKTVELMEYRGRESEYANYILTYIGIDKSEVKKLIKNKEENINNNKRSQNEINKKMNSIIDSQEVTEYFKKQGYDINEFRQMMNIMMPPASNSNDDAGPSDNKK